MSTHKLLAVGIAGAIGYMVHRWNSLPDPPQDESQQMPTEQTEGDKMSEHGEQPRVKGTAMHGSKSNGTTESSSTLKSVQQAAGDKMSSNVEKSQPEETEIYNDSGDVPNVIKTGSQASSDITDQQLISQDSSLHEDRGACNTNETQERMNLQENDTENQLQPRQSNRLCDSQQSLETDTVPMTSTPYSIYPDVPDVFGRCDIIYEGQNLQEPNSLTPFSLLSIRDDTLNSSEQSGNLPINTESGQTQISRTIKCDNRSIEHRNLQTLNNDFLSTSSAQPLILGNQNLNNQTSKIGRNNLERGQGQDDAVETSGDIMRNSEFQNLHSSLNPADHQAGVMLSHTPESRSTNNISIRNNQQGYQSSTETLYNRTDSVPVNDAVPYNSSSSKDLKKERDIVDAVVLHADEDREETIEFITHMEREFPDLNLNIDIYENILPETSLFGSAVNLFNSCRFLFVFVTQNFVDANLQRFLNEISLIETINFQDKNFRLIPVSTGSGYLPELGPLISLQYSRYLKAKSEQRSDCGFLRSFKMLITEGRKKYLVNCKT